MEKLFFKDDSILRMNKFTRPEWEMPFLPVPIAVRLRLKY